MAPSISFTTYTTHQAVHICHRKTGCGNHNLALVTFKESVSILSSLIISRGSYTTSTHAHTRHVWTRQLTEYIKGLESMSTFYGEVKVSLLQCTVEADRLCTKVGLECEMVLVWCSYESLENKCLKTKSKSGYNTRNYPENPKPAGIHSFRQLLYSCDFSWNMFCQILCSVDHDRIVVIL